MGSARTSVSATVGSLRAEPALVRGELSPRSTGLSLDANRGEKMREEGDSPEGEGDWPTGWSRLHRSSRMGAKAPGAPPRHSRSRCGSAKVAPGRLERAC